MDSPVSDRDPVAKRPLLSVVVPVFNEGPGLIRLHQRLVRTLETLPLAGRELIFVDDGSRDESFAVLGMLRQDDDSVKVIRFARNFGKEAAMAAGLRAATGNPVVMLDGDGQHPPEKIPEMFARWRAGARMVTAARRSRDTDPWLRRQFALGFYRLFKAISEIELERGGGDFRLFDRKVVDAINSLPERTRFMKGITSWVGFRQEVVDFEPEPRAAGSTKWSLLRLARYAMDGLSAFSTIPLRVWSLIGVVLAALSGAYGAYLVVRTAILGIDLPGYASLMVSTLFLSGVQLISLGVLGEYVGRIFTEVKARPLFLVSERLGFDGDPE